MTEQFEIMTAPGQTRSSTKYILFNYGSFQYLSVSGDNTLETVESPDDAAVLQFLL